MESKSAENGRFTAISDSKSLFPVMSGDGDLSHGRSCLFPSAQTVVNNAKRDNGQDWLENKSFTSVTAQKVVEFQHELKQLKNESKVDDVKCIEDAPKPSITSKLDSKTIQNYDKKKTIQSEHSDKISDSYVKKKRRSDDTKRSSHKKKKRKKHYESDSESDRDSRRKYSSDESDAETVKKKKKSEKHKKKKRKKYDDSDSDSDRDSRRKYSSDESDAETVKKKKKSKKHKKKKSHTKEAIGSEAKRKKDYIPGLFESKQIFADDIADIAPEHAFKLDRAPDKNSWNYGSLYKGHIANYKAVCNQCVDSDRKCLVFMKDLNKKQKDKQSIDRYYSKENRKIVKETISEVVATGTDSSRTCLLADYVHVMDVNEAIKSDRTVDVRDKVLDKATALYVSGEGKPTVDNSNVESTSYDPLRYKVSEFNKKLRETPQDIGLWMKFIEFQDRLSDVDMVGTESKEKITASGIFEKKISILDKALALNPGHIELMLAKIKLNAEISDSVKVNKDIEDLLFVHQANAQLWKYYLTFNQSRLSTLAVTKMTKLYHKCFKTLFGVLEGKVLTARKPENLEEEIIGIFLQYCYFLKQAGCKEHAVAVFQALLEYNFFVPDSLKIATKEVRMAAFAEFWDGNCARIGSSEALGWSKWLDMGKPENFVTSNNENLEEVEENIIEEKLPKHTTWLKIEHLRDNHHWLPWQPGQGQTLDDCGEEDLESLFLFDDIAPVLFSISENNRLPFVTSYLKFLGFHSEINAASAEKPDNILCEHLNDVMYSTDKNCIAHNMLKIRDRELPRNIATHTLNQLLPRFSDAEKSQMTLTLTHVQLSKYSGVDLSKQDKKEMRKIFKNILKTENGRNDLHLWCSYIKLERSIGKPGEVQAIVETALSMHSGESIEIFNEQTNGLISLFVQYCEILLTIDHNMPCKMLPKTTPVSMDTKLKVMHVLGILADSEKFNAKDPQILSDAAVLRVCAKYSTLCSTACEAVCSGMPAVLDERLRTLTWCYSLCLFCKGDINGSLDYYSKLISKITKSRGDNCKQLELELTLDKLRLILYYLSTYSVSLHVLREHLDTALEKFPDCPIILSLFVDVERMSRISGRLNRYFDRWCRVGNSVIPAVYAVMNQFALQKQAGSSGTSGLIHRGRTWLEHCLSRSNLQHCVLLWRIYLQLEKAAGDTTRLKGVFYRALQHCPWAKILYMDAIQMFGDDELQQMVDLMTEKHLHVHIPVEELDILMDS